MIDDRLPIRRVTIGPQGLEGDLTVPPQCPAIVLFAHGSGSSRRSPRNLQVAAALQARGLGTLLFDLLTEAEAADRERIFDTRLLGQRLVEALAWLDNRPALAALPTGLFGASTGAAAALRAAAARPGRIFAVVSRGGRPDLASDVLARVQAPTLLIVGGADDEVLALNRQAARRLGTRGRLEVVPGATHLFEESGALEHVAELAGRWFCDHLPAARRARVAATHGA